jgi:hypothetical protein
MLQVQKKNVTNVLRSGVFFCRKESLTTEDCPSKKEKEKD